MSLRRRLVARRAQGMTEYIIIVVLVAIAVLGAVRLFGTAVKGKVDSSKTSVENMENGGKAPKK